ncbi:alkylated DNA repair protein alkB homolog 8-like isoform X2 [Ostrea edulis]|uniref:alkylated DNA repair protein alkB homolog 8-like isoform X2 n=1 Tax=Ostrea edulis TaxID=37623 RepID=UPI0024AF01EA|nr:alkylated DNA repair protein alkB homolog 8-like isoform X2 [Ostrea edulis]
MAHAAMPKLSKLERKLQKKITKSQRTLLKHDGIETSDKATKILCVNNAGLDVGVSYDEVADIFSPLGEVEEIIMLPKKPYAFVCYEDIDAAERAAEKLNGLDLPQTPSRTQTATLYIFFVSKVPSGLSPSLERPPGLFVFEDFISEEEERLFLSAVDWETLTNERGELKHRQVKHFGFEFKYGVNDVDADDPLPQGIPQVCSAFLERTRATGHISHYPDQLTVNRYQPGQGIPSHIDTGPAFEDGIMSLSLGSQVLMDFYHPDGRQLSVLLPPRSLLIMTGESRYVWSHGITPRKSDIIPSDEGNLNVVPRGVRTSFTFRKIIHPMERRQREAEQRSGNKPTLPESSMEAETLESQHVHKVYEEIASHFSGTRHSPWPKIAEFLLKQPQGSVMADIGCGNGKYLGINKSIYQIGSDRSMKLMEICRQRGFQAFVGDVLSLPLRSDSLDVCLCIAVIHHLSTEERRIHAISELMRILRPGGQALVYVWAMEQEINKVKSKYLKEKVFDEGNCVENSSTNSCEQAKEDNSVHSRTDNSEYSKSDKCDISSELKPQKQQSVDKKELAVHKNRTHFQQQDLLVPWQLKGQSGPEKQVFHRFYHVFQSGELERICGQVSGCEVLNSYYDQGNWAVVLQKI